MHIRKARSEEGSILSALALRSKAHWNYDKAFIESCRDDLTVTKEDIHNSPIYVIEDIDEKGQKRLVGLAGFNYPEQGEEDFAPEILLFFIEPCAMGRGYGKALWKHMLQVAKEKGWPSFLIASDPNAKVFYEKMGATLIGEEPSTVQPGRMLPLLQYQIE